MNLRAAKRVEWRRDRRVDRRGCHAGVELRQQIVHIESQSVGAAGREAVAALRKQLLRPREIGSAQVVHCHGGLD
jgi:hypothetical protein